MRDDESDLSRRQAIERLLEIGAVLHYPERPCIVELQHATLSEDPMPIIARLDKEKIIRLFLDRAPVTDRGLDALTA